MDTTLNEATTAQLQEFINRLKSRVPETKIELQVREWPSDKSSNHQIVLQVDNPAFHFDVQADGDDLNKVLYKLEEDFADEIGQRKALAYMLAEGIDSDSPSFSLYLN